MADVAKTFHSVLSIILLVCGTALSTTQLEDKTAYVDRLFTYHLPSHSAYSTVRYENQLIKLNQINQCSKPNHLSKAWCVDLVSMLNQTSYEEVRNVRKCCHSIFSHITIGQWTLVGGYKLLVANEL